MQRAQQMFTFRTPKASDGASVWQLVKDTGVLDLNSAYSYIMFCDLFADTCVVAELDDEIVGFVSAFRKPNDEQTLFIWQIAVAAHCRGQGLAGQLLHQLHKQLRELSNAHAPIRFAELTISPSNQASQALFHSWAKKLNVPIEPFDGYRATAFPGQSHEDETGYRIGPFIL